MKNTKYIRTKDGRISYLSSEPNEEIAGHEHKGKSQSRLAYKYSLKQKRKLRKHKGHKHGGARR